MAWEEQQRSLPDQRQRLGWIRNRMAINTLIMARDEIRSGRGNGVGVGGGGGTPVAAREGVADAPFLPAAYAVGLPKARGLYLYCNI